MTANFESAVDNYNASLLPVSRDHRLLMNDKIFSYVLSFTVWGFGQVVTICGLIANVLNLIIFVRQGLEDSVNISLLGLSISDFGSLAFQVLINLCWTPAIIKLDLPFYPRQMMYFMFYCHVLFTRVTTGITAWIAVERCLCIVVPLKVKSIITPRLTMIYMCMLYVLMAASVTPMFYTSRFTWIFDSVRNKSVLGLVKIPNRSKIEGPVYIINNLLPTAFFVLIVACTVLLIKALLKNVKWRHSNLTQKEMPNRETKVVKLVFIISIVFIFCYAPGAIFFMWLLLDPDMKIDGRQKNFAIAFFSLVLLLENINAAANFFIYITMSSKFKMTFQELFNSIRKRKIIDK